MAFPIVRIGLLILLAAAPLGARQATPTLSKDQRATLQAVVAAVDAAAASPETPDVTWQTHLLRASDGSHYLAFSVLPPPALAPPPKTTLYVRLATRADPQSVGLSERSAVMEWLKGMRSDPLVSQKQRGIAFGEMPVFGAGAIAARGPGQQAGDLKLLSLERERARERREAEERERKAALEGTATRPRDAIFPFEDFTVDTDLLSASVGPVVRRSLTAGPGDYDLYVAWAAPEKGARTVPVRVFKSTLRLPPALTGELAVSSVILADAVGTLESPYPANLQSSHPYALGALEIAPARDDVFTNDERLAVVFQVMNARANTSGKPDVGIAFQLFKVTPAGDQSVGMLNPQTYNESTLPAEFDLAKGHPLFAAMAAPLKTIGRGDYRLRVTATDKLSGTSAVSHATFTIVATPATLLTAAPRGVPFEKETLLAPEVLRDLAGLLRTDPMSPALSAALTAATDARYVDLLRDDAVEPGEQGARMTLRGLGLYAMGDPRMARTILGQALQRATPNPVAQLFVGACRALEANDREAAAAWQTALDGGLPARLVAPLLLDAHLRLGDLARASEIAKTADPGTQPALARGLAALAIESRREAEALPLLERHLAEHSTDLQAQFLWLHAVYASFVNARGPGATTEGKDQFRARAKTYIDAKARHAPLVAEWLLMIEHPPTAPRD